MCAHRVPAYSGKGQPGAACKETEGWELLLDVLLSVSSWEVVKAAGLCKLWQQQLALTCPCSRRSLWVCCAVCANRWEYIVRLLGEMVTATAGLIYLHLVSEGSLGRKASRDSCMLR